MKNRTVYGVMAAGGLAGLVASFWQMLDKLALLENQEAALSCNINNVFSCSNVLSSWQSSVFGFPNALMSLVLFVIFASVGLAGLSGGNLTARFRLGIQAMALFTLGFGLWFLLQSAFVIGALCILCIFNFAGLLVINWSWVRINANDLPFGRAVVLRGTKSGADTFIWALVGLVVAFAMLAKFY